MKRDFLSILDINAKELMFILGQAVKLKKERANKRWLDRKTLVMIFEKPSLRTKLSFSIGMTQLGGNAVYMGPTEIGLGSREPVKDIAAVTGSMADVIMARTFKHETVVEMAKYSAVPVINGLSDREHPCQIMADLLTIFEIKKKLKGLKVCYIGDCANNVAQSLALACKMIGIEFALCGPKNYGGQIENPKAAVHGADVIYTDTWVSMGDEQEKEERLKAFRRYQVTPALMKLAKRDAIFMHDLPAYRGNEVSANVIDGPQSVIYQQAENRLHAQKAILLFLLWKI